MTLEEVLRYLRVEYDTSDSDYHRLRRWDNIKAVEAAIEALAKPNRDHLIAFVDWARHGLSAEALAEWRFGHDNGVLVDAYLAWVSEQTDGND